MDMLRNRFILRRGLTFGLALAAVAAAYVSLAVPMSAQEKVEPKVEKKPKFELKDGDRVVFLGNTFIERMQRYGYVEAALTARFPDADVTFRNLGWSGDTVWAESRGIFDPPAQGYLRMLDHVKRLQPTVIFLGYGNNEAHAGKPGLPRFIKQYERLLDDLTKVSAKGVRFVMLSPIPYEEVVLTRGKALPSPHSYNKKLGLYVTALRTLAEKRKHIFVDLADYVNKSALLRRFSVLQLRGQGRQLTEDTIHLTDFGYTEIASNLTYQLGLDDGLALSHVSITRAGNVESVLRAKATEVKPTPEKLSFTLLCEYLPPSPPGSLGVLVSVKDADDRRYEIRVDGKLIGQTGGRSQTLNYSKVDSPPFNERLLPRRDNKKLEKRPWQVHPDDQQFEKLRQAIVEKNQLYFHRWRPQNVTYLYLFRKHEQGNNAKEVLEFDKLVAEKEREIARLRKPVPHRYELVRVKEEK